jgi:hypothetical protein
MADANLFISLNRQGWDSLHIGVDGDTPPMGYRFNGLDVEDEQRSP